MLRMSNLGEIPMDANEVLYIQSLLVLGIAGMGLLESKNKQQRIYWGLLIGLVFAAGIALVGVCLAYKCSLYRHPHWCSLLSVFVSCSQGLLMVVLGIAFFFSAKNYKQFTV